MAASTSRGRAAERASAVAGTACARARGSAFRRRPSAWAVATAILASAARGAGADLTATRPLEAPAVARNREVPRVTAPRVAPGSVSPAHARSSDGSARPGDVDSTREVADRSARVVGHSPAFLRWAARHDKLGDYCPGSAPPCEESLHREAVFQANAAAIEAHNQQSGSLMKKGLTRFADLTVEEFTAAHATYAGGAPAPIAARVSRGTSNSANEASFFPKNARGKPPPRRAFDPRGDAEASRVISLKLATDEAAARGEALPSEEEEEEEDAEETTDGGSSASRVAADDADAALIAQTTSSPFPALGAPAGLSAEERRAAARGGAGALGRRRATARAPRKTRRRFGFPRRRRATRRAARLGPSRFLRLERPRGLR